MYTSSIITYMAIALAPQFGNADWQVATADCATGLDSTSDGFSDGGAYTASQGVCNGGAVPAFTNEGDFDGANPCAIGDEVFDYTMTGDDAWDVSVQDGDGSVIGKCVTSISNDLTSCDTAAYSCIYMKQLDCTSTYCN